jgi:hypothetical protein
MYVPYNSDTHQGLYEAILEFGTPMLLRVVHSLIPWSRFIPEKSEVPVYSSWNPQAQRIPSLERRKTLRIPEKNPQENFWT